MDEPERTWIVRAKNPPQFNHYRTTAQTLLDAWERVRGNAEIPEGVEVVWEEPEDWSLEELMEGWPAELYPWPDHLVPTNQPTQTQHLPVNKELWEAGYLAALGDAITYLHTRLYSEAADGLYNLLSDPVKRNLSRQLKKEIES